MGRKYIPLCRVCGAPRYPAAKLALCLVHQRELRARQARERAAAKRPAVTARQCAYVYCERWVATGRTARAIYCTSGCKKKAHNKRNRAAANERVRRWRKRLTEGGWCRDCGAGVPSERGRLCVSCQKKGSARAREYYRQCVDSGLCWRCRRSESMPKRTVCLGCAKVELRERCRCGDLIPPGRRQHCSEKCAAVVREARAAVASVSVNLWALRAAIKRELKERAGR